MLKGTLFISWTSPGINNGHFNSNTFFSLLFFFLFFPRNSFPKDGSQEYTTKAVVSRTMRLILGKNKGEFCHYWKS